MLRLTLAQQISKKDRWQLHNDRHCPPGFIPISILWSSAINTNLWGGAEERDECSRFILVSESENLRDKSGFLIIILTLRK